MEEKTFGAKPEGVCCKAMKITVKDDTLVNVEFFGGCPGNALGIGKLIQNKKIQEVIDTLKGIKCGNKQTSCPDQLAKALEEYVNGNN